MLRIWSSAIVTPSVSYESTKREDVSSFAIVPRTSGRGWRVRVITPRSPVLARLGRLFDVDDEIGSLPSVHLRPIEREIHTVATSQARRGKVRHVDAQRRVVCHRIAYGPPAIHTPMHRGLRQRLDAERSAGGHRPHFVVRTPDDVPGRGRFFSQEPPNGLTRPPETPTLSQSPPPPQRPPPSPPQAH